MTQLHPEKRDKILQEVVLALKSHLPLADVLGQVLTAAAAGVTGSDFGVLMIWESSSGLFRPWASYGCEAHILKRIGLRAGESITGRVYDDGCPLLLNTSGEVGAAMSNLRAVNRSLLTSALGRSEPASALLAAPVATSQQKFGVLVLQSFQPQPGFLTADVPFVQLLADLVAVAIELSRLEERADATRQAREAEHLRSEALATLSHELRLPLTTIKGYTTMLLMNEIDWGAEKMIEYLQLIDQECDDMHAMINDILDSALIDFKQIPIEPQPLRLGEIAAAVAAELKRQSQPHHLVVEFPKDFPLVSADIRWIKQVFRNILDNAIKYSPGGGLVVIRGEARTEDVVVSIADQGIGISPEHLIPLFEKFFRVRSPHTRHIPGAGLGLPISRAIIEMHGGRIWAESCLNQGTTIYFSLPRIRAQTAPLAGQGAPV